MRKGYTVIVAALPECISKDDSKEEAIECYIERNW